MWRSAVLRSLNVGRISQLGTGSPQVVCSRFCTMVQSQTSNQLAANGFAPSKEGKDSKDLSQLPVQDFKGVQRHRIGEIVSGKDKISFLVTTLLDLKDSKEAIYGALDAWVAWEQNFPIASLKNALLILEKEQQWHRVVQVIKWMLSKGQGNTMRTYGQLIHALDLDHRAEEAHKFWVMKIGTNLHSVPWQICRSMISIYYRNNMLENLIKLFKELEAYGRKPPEKTIVQRVANSYEMLGKIEEKERLLEKYSDLFTKKEEKTSFKKPKKK